MHVFKYMLLQNGDLCLFFSCFFFLYNYCIIKVIRDRFLFGIIGVMLLLDFLILIPWQIIDPIHIEDETHHIPQVRY